MGLREEIERDLNRAFGRDPAVLEVATGQQSITDIADPETLRRLLIRMQGAHREAILRLASEIDDLRAT